MDADFITRLLSGIRGDEKELEMINVIHRRVMVVCKDGATVRRSPGIANNIVKIVRCGTVFETTFEESADKYNNRWLQIPEGFICTFYNGTLRAVVEEIPK